MAGFWGHGGTYQTWADHLRRWAEEADTAAADLPVLRPEDYHQDTWVRFTELITAALDRRLRAWGHRLTTALTEAADEFAVGRALVQARPGLAAVRALAAHPSLPADLRERLSGIVDRQIADLQRQLEDQLDREARAGADPRSVGARRRTYRENPLTAAAGPAAPPAPPAWSYDPAAPARRRIVTDRD
ncbi:hypothetical protein [Streptomyces sp. NPDC012888]|uniref:hypothetical protein n=1 Tax=Streptomyces sp. NPDC012888 TaxID=3364855 RepID=UPI0036CE7441